MYRLIDGQTNAVQRIADGAFIPFDDLNRDYVAYKAWLAAGNTPQPIDNGV